MMQKIRERPGSLGDTRWCGERDDRAHYGKTKRYHIGLTFDGYRDIFGDFVLRPDDGMTMVTILKVFRFGGTRRM